MKTTNTDFEPLVFDLVAEALSTRSATVAAVPTYPDSIVYRATDGDRSVVFKAVDPAGRDPDGIGLEAWAIDAAGASGVPVPKILAVDTSGTVFPSSFLIMTAVEGQPLESLDEACPPEQRLTVNRRIGEALARLHAVRVPGFGWLDEARHRETGEVRGRHDSWRDAVFADVPAALDYLDAFVDADARGAVASLEAAGLDAVSPGLLHGDLGTNHVWVDPAEMHITGLIDFGERAAGDWVWDLLEIEPRDVPGVLDGYGVAAAERAKLERRFWCYALLKAIPWAAKWHARGEVQVLEWLSITLDRSPNFER